jgi:hypothetical protein
MLKKIFRKAFLLSGILLLSVFVVAQYTWGCDDRDKWGCDDHDRWGCDDNDKWSCNKQDEPCHPPKIQIVYLNYNDESIEFTIWGKNFSKGGSPVVTLGGIYDLIVDGYDDDEITATLPIEGGLFDYGDYRLVVSTCHDSKCNYCNDYCYKCKDKHCRDYCSKCKDKYCKDYEYECKCKDRYSLTITGPSGPTGLIRTEIVKSEGKADIPNKVAEGSAYCPAGYMVTGGGFSAFTSVIILVNKPLDDGKGWFVSGKVDGEYATLEVYAVCVQMQ